MPKKHSSLRYDPNLHQPKYLKSNPTNLVILQQRKNNLEIFKKAQKDID